MPHGWSPVVGPVLPGPGRGGRNEPRSISIGGCATCQPESSECYDLTSTESSTRPSGVSLQGVRAGRSPGSSRGDSPSRVREHQRRPPYRCSGPDRTTGRMGPTWTPKRGDHLCTRLGDHRPSPRRYRPGHCVGPDPRKRTVPGPLIPRRRDPHGSPCARREIAAAETRVVGVGTRVRSGDSKKTHPRRRDGFWKTPKPLLAGRYVLTRRHCRSRGRLVPTAFRESSAAGATLDRKTSPRS